MAGVIGNHWAFVCTADIGEEVEYCGFWTTRTHTERGQRLNTFLETTYEYSRKVDCEPSLLLVTSWDQLNNNKSPRATMPPFTDNVPVIPDSLDTIAKYVAQASSQLPQNALAPKLFAVLDERSVAEDNGLLVQVKENGVDTVRVHFDSINSELIRVSVIAGNIDDTKNLAANFPDGISRSESSSHEGRRKGGQAPRKQLAAPKE